MTEFNPHISVILPVYNVANYLPRCLDSILKQTLTQIEIIAVNDGSTDNSLDILENYYLKDNRIQIINKINGGYGSSINEGLKAASGTYIGIVETDDWIDENMYKILFDHAVTADVDIVKAGFFNAYSMFEYIEEKSFVCLRPPSELFNIQQYPQLLKFKPSVWSAIYKTEFLKSNQIKMVETPGASFQDLPFTFETFCLAGSIQLVKKPLYFYFQDNKNSSVQNIKQPFFVFQHFDYINQFLQKHQNIKKNVWAMKCRAEYTHYFWNFQRAERKDKNFFFKEMNRRLNEFTPETIKFIQFSKTDQRLINYILKDKYFFFKFNELFRAIIAGMKDLISNDRFF